MKKHVIKLIVCIMLISALMIGFCSAYAHAALPNRTAMQRFNAWVASAMVAANITIGSTVAPVQQVLDSLSYGANMPWTPEYTYQGATWDDDILDRSKIYIAGDVVEIDGVPYTDIWLSNDAAQKFRVNAFDLETAWNIASNSNGTYATGSGYLDGIPIYHIGNDYKSQYYTFTFPDTQSSTSFSAGNVLYNAAVGRYNTLTFTANYSNSSTATANPALSNVANLGGYVQYTGSNPSNLQGKVGKSGQTGGATFSSFASTLYEEEAFDFDWVSELIPAEQLPEDYGMHFLVPSSYDGGQGSNYNYDIHDLITLNPNITDPGGYEFNFDPSLNPDFQLDIDSADALGAIISAVIAAYLADLLDGDGVKIEYSVNHPEPDPQPGVIDPLPDPDPAPDIPEPGDTIADTDWTKLDEILRWIQSTIDSIRHLTESLQTMLDSIFDAIQSAIQHIAEIPDAIRELADKILEDIELGPSKLFDKALDILKTLFLPLLLPIRAMMNLWHYVVEWIQSITNPFTWIFGIMSGTSGNMVLPIYALLAGGICISIYKALGR